MSSTFECEYSKETNRCKKNQKMIKSDENCEKSIKTSRCTVKKSKTTNMTDKKKPVTKSNSKSEKEIKMLSYFEKFYSTNNIYHIKLEKDTIKYLKNKYGYYDKTISENRLGNYEKYGLYKSIIPLDPSIHDEVAKYGAKNKEYDYIQDHIPYLIPNIQEGDMIYINAGNYNQGTSIGGKDFNLYTVEKHFNDFKLYDTILFHPNENTSILNGLLKRYFENPDEKDPEVIKFYNQYGIHKIKNIKPKHVSYKTVKKSDNLKKQTKEWKSRAEMQIKDINERLLDEEEQNIKYYNRMIQRKDKKSKQWVKENEHKGKNTFELWLNSNQGKKTMENVLKFEHISYNDIN